MSGRSFM